MKYELNTISAEFSKKGIDELNFIKSILVKYDLCLLESSPTCIRFKPWAMSDYIDEKEIFGIVRWNPVNQTMIIEYHLYLEYPKSFNPFSLILKWYLSKWNEAHLESFNNTEIKFIYSTKTSPEIILCACRKMAHRNMDKRIQMLLLQLHDIICSEYLTITSILIGECPYTLRQEILAEISGILSELGITDYKEIKK